MASFIPNSPPSPQEVQFKQQLKLFSKPGILTGKLIVKEQGTLAQTNFLHALWEKFKGICGFRNWTNERLVEFKTLQFLSEGKKWIHSQEDIERVKALASRAGLTTSTQSDHRELQLLVDEICQTPLKSEKEETTDDLLTKFVIHYQKELQPFPKEILKVSHAFAQTLPQQIVLAPSIKQKDDDLAEDRRETESEDDQTSTSQDNGHASDQKSSEVPSSIPVLSEENILPSEPVIPKIDNSYLLKIPEISDEDRQEATGPQFPAVEKNQAPLIDQNETQPVAKVLTPQDLSSRKWKTAGKVALIAAGTIAVLAATYYAWQYFGSTAPNTTNGSLEEPVGYQSPNGLMPQITNIADRVITLIYPTPEAALVADNSTIIEQVVQGFSPISQTNFVEQFTPANISSNIVDAISLPNPLDIVPQNIIDAATDIPQTIVKVVTVPTPLKDTVPQNIIEVAADLPQSVIKATTDLIKISQEVVKSSLPVCLPGENPALSSNTTILDFISGLGDHSSIPTQTPSFIPTPDAVITQDPIVASEEVVQTVVEQASYIKEICGAIFLTLGLAAGVGAVFYKLSNNKQPEAQVPPVQGQNQASPILDQGHVRPTRDQNLVPQTEQKASKTESKKESPDKLGENAASSSKKASGSKPKRNKAKQTTTASQLVQPTLLTTEEISKMSPDQKGELIDKYALREKTGKCQLSGLQLQAMLNPLEPTVKIFTKPKKGYYGGLSSSINSALQKEALSQDDYLPLIADYYQNVLGYSDEDAVALIADCDVIKFIFKEKFGVEPKSGKINDLVQPNQSKQKTLENFLSESDWAIIANESDAIYEMPSKTKDQYPFKKGGLAALSKDESGNWWYLDSRSPHPINIDLAVIPSSCTIITSDRKASSLIPLPEIEKEDEHTEIKAKEKAPDQPKTTLDPAVEDQKNEKPLIPDLMELTAGQIRKRVGKMTDSTPNRAEKIKAYTQRLRELEGIEAASSARTTFESTESATHIPKEAPAEEIARRRESGSKILAQWLQNNTLTFHDQPITDTNDYNRLLIEKSCNAMKVYSTLYQISISLNKFKESELLNLSKGVPETANRLHDIHDALLALEGQKEIFLNKLLKNNQDFELIFKHIQDFIGSDTDFPIDFKIALILLIPTKELKKNLLTYLQVATSEKHKTLDPTIELSSSSSGKNQGNPIQAYFSNEIQPEAFNSLSTLDDYSGPNLIADLNAFHMWILARAGSEINTQIITDSIELGLQTKTKETDREINAVQRNKSLAPFLPQEERQLAQDDFRPWVQYGINVRNEWQEKGSLIYWKGTIASKKPDGSYKRHTFTDTIDLNKLNGFTKQDKKIALKFIADHCQSGKSIKGRESLFFAPVYLQSILNNDPDFWRWINIGSPASDEKADIYSQLLPSIIEKYNSLLHLAHDFSETIQEASIKTFVDTSQDLSKVKDMPEMVFNDTSFADEEDVFDPEGNDVVNIEIGNQLPQDPLAQQGSPSSWGVLGTIGNAVLNAGTLAVSPLRSVGGIIATTTTNALQGFNQAIADPLWATKKYKLALSMFDSINITGLKTSKLKAGLEQLLSAQKMSKEHATSRYAHTLFLESLRAMLSSTEFQEELKKKIDKKPYDDSVNLLLQICTIRFEEGHLYSFCDNLIAEVLPADKHGGELVIDDFDLIDAVDSSKRLLGVEVSAKKLAGHLNLGFDPHLQGNIPFVLGTVKIGNKDVKLLRTGTPTIEGLIGKAEINPEFRGYIQQLQFIGKKHLYISLQNDKSKNFVSGDESGRNGAIKGLQEDFPETFFSVVLAQDSRFYKQVDKVGNFLGDEAIDVFKTTFYRQMTLPGDTGFYFPPQWKNDPNFKHGLHQLLEDVHATIFPEKEVLNRQEKLDFIEIYYAYLSIYLMNYSQADNANITCKDAIDRAGKLNSLVLKLIMTIQGKGRDPINLRIHKVFTHAPAFFVKSQAIIKSHSEDKSNGRRERLMSAHNEITKPDVAKRIQENSIIDIDKTAPRSILPIKANSKITIERDDSQTITD